MALAPKDRTLMLGEATALKKRQEDHPSVFAVMADPREKHDDMKMAKSSASVSTASGGRDCLETFSCHSLSDVEEAEDEEALRSRAATGVSLGDWWDEDAPLERARGLTMLTEYDLTGSTIIRLLQEDAADDAESSSHFGGRRASFATPSSNMTLTHSFALAADCGGVIVCPVADDRFSLSVCGQTDDYDSDSGDDWGQEELHMELKAPQEGSEASKEEKEDEEEILEYQALHAELGQLKAQLARMAALHEAERESVAPPQLQVSRNAEPAAQVDFVESSYYFGGASQGLLSEAEEEEEEAAWSSSEEEEEWAAPSALAIGSAVSDAAAGAVESCSEAAASAVVSTVSQAAGVAWIIRSAMSSLFSECSMEDARHADSRVAIHMAIGKSGSMLW